MVGKRRQTFQRARRPEHRLERRDALLDAAGTLFESMELHALTLALVAKRAGVSKATVYGYFETKEALLLAVLMRELESFFGELEGVLERRTLKALTDVADVVAGAVFKRPLFVRLLSRLFVDLEHNLSFEVALAFKQSLGAQLAHAGASIERHFPKATKGAGARTLLQLSGAIAGLWPMTNSVGAVREVLARPEMAPLRIDFQPEVRAVARALFIANLSPASPKPRSRS